MTWLLTQLICCAPFLRSDTYTFSSVCLFCFLSEHLPWNLGCVCVCVTGVLSGMRNVWPCGKDADSEGSIPGGSNPVLAAGEPQGHWQALCGGHGEIYRGLWLQGAVSLMRNTHITPALLAVIPLLKCWRVFRWLNTAFVFVFFWSASRSNKLICSFLLSGQSPPVCSAIWWEQSNTSEKWNRNFDWDVNLWCCL